MNKEELDFIKTYQGMIKKIMESRMQHYFNQVVDEPDPQRKEVLSMLVKEFRAGLVGIQNIGKMKENVKPGEEFTGV